MTDTYLQGRQELENHLDEQIQFMKLSAHSFDSGFEGEAKRLASCIRVLVHDTKNSKSLLGQLDMKNRYYWDSRGAVDVGWAKESDSFFVLVQVTEAGPRYIPVLERGPFPMLQSDFDKWWNGIVLIDGKGIRFTRKELVLSLANQDGGAHVDPTLDEKYASLSRNNSFGWATISDDEKKPLIGIELSAVRQITHEILKTLDQDYAPKIAPLSGFCIGMMNPDIPGLQFRFDTPHGPVQLDRRGTGRNDPCPCRSGKKYKKCHGR
jgi:hypothetical protein